jgi:TetR/AcrR family transcriptional regulator, ethionamide resistance regulator
MPAVTRKPAAARARRRDRARGEVLAILRRLLEEGETFSEISVERLASEAGISRTTFYVYFEDKTDVLREWYAEMTEELVAAAQHWWGLGPGATRADLREGVSRIVGAYRPHTALLVATHEAAGYDAAVRDLVESAMEVYIAGLRRHIRAGQRAGFVDPELPPGQSAFWLAWMAERGLHRAIAAPGPELERLIDAYAAIVWNALYAPTKRG